MFGFCLLAVGQEKLPCPTVSAAGPEDLVKAGEKLIFTAKVDGIEPEKINYEWTVSAGKIAEGQGTAGIKSIRLS